MFLLQIILIFLFLSYTVPITFSVYYGRTVYRFTNKNNLVHSRESSANNDDTCFGVEEKIQDAHCSSQYCKETASLSRENAKFKYVSHNSFVPAKRFGSACLRCLACLVVAEQIDKHLNDLWKILRYRYRRKLNFIHENPERVRVLIDKPIAELCSQGFHNFALREHKGKTILTDSTQNTKLVLSPMDGYWTEKLREICVRLTSEIDLLELYVQYIDLKELKSEATISDLLCRGHGVFSECRNLNIDNKMERKCRLKKPWRSHIIFS